MGSNENPAPHHETPTFGNPDLPREGMVNTTGHPASAKMTGPRNPVRIAQGMLETMGMNAFAERAGRELLATSEHGRPRPAAVPLPSDPGTKAGTAAGKTLTAQEAQVARLARDGLSNPEIAIRLFISPRTVQHHLSKVFAKLGISSRGELHLVLPPDPDHGAALS
jgi:DNA-binding CsgD family transcriptional regulator